ncbi:pyridoxamine 5'-phosphate oxidase [Paenibacillus nanensis]|uniref:Pyridoxamine 5'-phosphate oxidase n=1 Tax=Paenibacillus nanensis TaxID=393251 RepID=A0A3A1VGQ5_9BACL|nr:pyridoxamine 5'-phosphate oxidase family protein [Paenibacillus nanensis]RIX59571.1 pyridoxamine 5'-phosphate oxidase [Paenibacillus nanensis]
MSVYHSGELAVQRLAGAAAAAEQNGKGIRNTIPKGVAGFLSAQSLVIVATAAEGGSVWCSMLTGKAGFMVVLDEVTLTIASVPLPGDPLLANVSADREIGLLVIDLENRIRVRINGTASYNDGRLRIHVEQVYGNCPKYIQKRAMRSQHGFLRLEQTAQRSTLLSPEQIEWIRRSDTFFISSKSADGKADASHRGGSPGFIRTLDERTLDFPDYFGNSMFNTLGNIYSNPCAGMLFIDFDKGHTLQLTGQCEIIWDKEQIAQFPHAERLIRFEVSEVLYTEVQSNLHWEFVEYSPANPASSNN